MCVLSVSSCSSPGILTFWLGFKVLSEAERTAALYSLLQHSTQVQIRFFITVLQQMARSDPMTALLSPAVGSEYSQLPCWHVLISSSLGSMQSQMEAKLAQMNLKSPSLKSGLPASPTARNFSPVNRPNLGLDTNPNGFLSPDTANLPSAGGNDPAATLAQQRARLEARKASNAAHRISAPALSASLDNRNWVSGPNQLGQVDERPSSPGAQELTIPTGNTNASRPKSTDFTGAANALKSAKLEDGMSPMAEGSWASMVNTPLMPMFKDTRNAQQSLDAAAVKLNDWTATGGNGVPLIADPPKRLNRLSKGSAQMNDDESHSNSSNQGNNQHGQRNTRNVSGGSNGFGGQGGWNGVRSPALSQNSRHNDDNNNMNGLGMAGFGMGMGSPGLGMGMPGMGGFGGMPLSPFGNMFNMQNLAAMNNMTPEQLLALQMTAAAQLGQAGLGGFGMGMHPQSSPSARSGLRSARSPGKSPSVRDKKDEEDVDPKVLEDVPAWLRSLRLHKYTPNFEDVNWKDMVLMDEAALEAKGVAALGARRKMLKTFEIVRKKMGIPEPAGSVPVAA